MGSQDEVSSSTRRTRPFRVAVEGNIGSGKSTFLEYCKLHPDVEVVPEPVSEWTDLRGTNLLVSINNMNKRLRDTRNEKNGANPIKIQP